MPKSPVVKKKKKSEILEVVAKKRGRPRNHPVVEEVAKRRPGRPRLEHSAVVGAKQALAYAKGDKKAGKAHVVDVTVPKNRRKSGEEVVEEVAVGLRRRHKITNEQLLQSEVQSGRVTLAANRVVDQIQGMLSRAEIQQFRGRKERPQLVLSLLEQQMLQEVCALYELKLTLQRGGSLRRKSAS